MSSGDPPIPVAELRSLLRRALEHRERIAPSIDSDAMRLLGPGDGSDMVTVDRYGPGAVMTIADGASTVTDGVRALADAALELIAPLGVTSVYYKPLPRDRSRLGGAMPGVMTDPTPAAGAPLPESIPIREHDWTLEVRLYDGFSTGLFFDQRSNRAALSGMVRGKTVLNTFAYTGAFSVACARHGAATTTVDISKKYLEWAKRNFALNAIDASGHFFNRMDTFEFFRLAARKNLRYDLIILDPPTFASGSKRDNVAPFSAERDYPRLISDAVDLLTPNGRIFASTNCRTLCARGRFRSAIESALRTRPAYHEVPAHPQDLDGETGRLACAFFTPR